MAADLRAVHPEHSAEAQVQAQEALFSTPSPAAVGALPVEPPQPVFSSLENFLEALSDFCVARGYV
jgi:hypothetical protein